MSTNGPIPLQAWTCPHCQAVWHSGRQYCVDCGYGTAQGPDAALPWPTETVTHEEMRRRPWAAPPGLESLGAALQDLEQAQRAGGSRADATAGSDAETLRRSLAAESALQEEVTLLRERTTQLTQALEEQKRTLVEGVQQLLEPLLTLCERGGRRRPPYTALAQELEAWIGEMAGAHAARQRGRQPGAQAPRSQAALEGQVGRLASMVGALEERMCLVERARGQEPGEEPETYRTWVTTDAQAQAVEKAILEAQGRGRGSYGG